jgi:hypothetical protein
MIGPGRPEVSVPIRMMLPLLVLPACLDFQMVKSDDDGPAESPPGDSAAPDTVETADSAETAHTAETAPDTGAIAGYMGAGPDPPCVERVVVTGSVDGSEHVGGVVGESYNGGGVFDARLEVAVSGSSAVGGVIGYAWDGTLNRVARVSVAGSVRGGGMTGGLIGYNKSNFVHDCVVSATVSGTSAVGGLVGYTTEGGSITDAYVSGEVAGDETVGGVLGAFEPYGGGATVVSGVFAVGPVGTSQPHGVVGSGPSSGITNAWWDACTTLTPSCHCEAPGVCEAANLDCADVTRFWDAGAAPQDTWDPAVWDMPGSGYPDLRDW